jgi:hypothetical protein
MPGKGTSGTASSATLLELGIAPRVYRSWRPRIGRPANLAARRSETVLRRVRVKIGRHWRAGTAEILREDDALERLRQTGRYNARAVRFWGNPDELLTVRIDLDPS